MAKMASTATTAYLQSPRQRLSARQAKTVATLLDAAIRELRRVGYDDLSLRSVAKQAGVTATTAYTYFSSKDHLITEVFWRRLDEEKDQPGSAPQVGDRVRSSLDQLARLICSEPDLAQACAVAMLGPDPDVQRLRTRIGAEMHRRLARAAAGELSEAALRAIDLVISGALVQAGMGHLDYDNLADELDQASRLIIEGDHVVD